jgi:hypothetical protein
MASSLNRHAKTEHGWSIASSKFGFYYNSFHDTKKGAIEQHTSALGKTWKQCRDSGDYCVKSTLRVRRGR